MDAHPTLIGLTDITKSFGSRRVLDRLSWSLHVGESAVILGPSGAGKSVFLSILLGFEPPDAGERRLAPELDRDFFGTVSVLFQEDALLDDRTVEANLVVARTERLDFFGGSLPAELSREIDAALRDVGLDPEEVRAALPSALSGGMRRRVALARALIRSPKLLVADEPTTGLDPQTARGILELMARLIAEKGMSAVIITHDPLCAALLGRPIYLFTPREPAMRRFPQPPPGSPPPHPSGILAWIEGMGEGEPDLAAFTEEPPSPRPLPHRLGEGALAGLEALGRALLFFRHLRSAPSPRLLLRDLRLWGLDSAPLVALIFALLGLVMEIQGELFVAAMGFSNRMPEFLAFGMTRMAPIIAGFLMAGRCGSAVAARAGWMRLSGQDRALRSMRVDPDAALFPPIFWSWVVALPALAAVGMASGWGVAWALIAVGASSARITPVYFLNGLAAALTPTAAVSVVVKTALMAGGGAAIAHSLGAAPKRSPLEATRAITRSLVLSFVWIAVVDAVVSLVIRP